MASDISSTCDIYYIRHLDAETPIIDGKKAEKVVIVDGKEKTEKALAGGAKPGSERDTGLKQTEIAKAQNLGQKLVEKLGISLSAIYSSPMKRTHETLAPMAAQLKLPIQVDPRLDELNHGELLDAKENWHSHPAWIAYKPKSRLEKLTTPQAQGAESNCQVIDRMREFAFSTAAKHPNQTVVCSSHDGAMRSLLNLEQIEKAYGKVLGKEQPSADAVRALQAQPNVAIPEAKHFDKGEILHVQVNPTTNEIKIVEMFKIV